MVSNQDVFRLEIPVVDSNGMAVFHGIQDLEKSPLGKGIIPNILAALRDVGEEIAFWAILNHDVRAVGGIHNLDQGNNIGVSAGLVVKLNLSLLELALSWLEANLVQRLNSIWGVCLDVHGSVDYSISSNS